jgi:sulfotransferase family protein
LIAMEQFNNHRTASDHTDMFEITTVPSRPNDPVDLLVILAPPRSFTTIVSAMLGQHPQLYGLPELHLFSAETLGEWWGLCSQASYNMDHGLLRVTSQLFFGSQTEKTVRRAGGWLRRRSHLTTGALLELCAENIHPRILVEKSPSVVYRPEFLRRLYRMFPNAKFIHLVRHPRAQGKSVMKYLQSRQKLGPVPASHWLLHLAGYPSLSSREAEAMDPISDLDPQRSWYALNMNICEFLEAVPVQQKLRIRGEDLLSDPDRVLSQIASWTGITTDSKAIAEMKHPERSPYSRLGPPGAQFGNDRNFLNDPFFRPQAIKPENLDDPLGWRADGAGFWPEVRDLAYEFGYR